MINKKLLFFVIGLLIVATIVATLLHTNDSPVSKRSRTILHLPPSIEATVFKTDSGFWGYEISVSNQRLIYQENIPSVPGNKPFHSQDDAIKCSNLVVQKMKGKKNPTISLSEIDSLGIIY